MSRIKLVNIISEIKQLNGDFDKAAKYIAKELKGTRDISGDIPGYKYGAYSHEAWDELFFAMKLIGLNPNIDDPEIYDKVSKFNEQLQKLKLIYIEW
jgi:hypothetical protein